MAVTEAVPLPPNRPGRLPGLSQKTKRDDRAVGPTVGTREEMCRIALEVADETFPLEVSMLAASDALKEVQEMCGGPECEIPPDALAKALARDFVDLLWTPIAGCVPLLRNAPVDEVRMKVQLFWRSLIALCSMPLPHLAAQTNRKRQFLPQLELEYPPTGATPAESRRAHIRLNLPIFSLVARFPAETKPYEANARNATDDDGINRARDPQQLSGEDGPGGKHDTTKLEITHGSEKPDEVRSFSMWAENASKSHSGKILSAARHTHDLGYNRWDKFDADAALRELDAPQRKHRVQEVDISKLIENPTLQHDNPIEALDKALAELPCDQNGEDLGSTGVRNLPDGSIAEAVAGEKANHDSGVSARVENVENTSDPKAPSSEQAAGRSVPRATADSDNSNLAEVVQFAGATNNNENSTAAKLSKEYQRWEYFDASSARESDGDDLNDLDGDEHGDFDISKSDLDAIKGPLEEVAQIQKHWRKEERKRKADARKEQQKQREDAKKAVREARAKDEIMQRGPVIGRPCEFRHVVGSSGVEGETSSHNEKWKSFDADVALLEFENEGTTEEGTAMRCTNSKKSALLGCENYTKDREEYDLDKDIEVQVGELKKSLAQRLADACSYKLEGNALMRQRKYEDACDVYRSALEAMELCSQASVIMADGMSKKQEMLRGDLHRNLAAAQLELGHLEDARSNCDDAIKLQNSMGNTATDEKAHFRRATALIGLGQHTAAKADINVLANLLGEEDPAVQKLRSKLGSENLASMD